MPAAVTSPRQERRPNYAGHVRAVLLVAQVVHFDPDETLRTTPGRPPPRRTRGRLLGRSPRPSGWYAGSGWSGRRTRPGRTPIPAGAAGAQGIPAPPVPVS